MAACLAADVHDVWPSGQPPQRPSSPETRCHHVQHTPRLYQERIKRRPRRRRTVKVTSLPPPMPLQSAGNIVNNNNIDFSL
ncbi:unnamed protein product [Macrosiphum euphorbiae]|uniref:Uncharacterized protein n=1 Tax=Macrosiphum euphorbiae TaxID=13131 RepID=A0AAV0XH55_9HEMI|nr:unnamed protein product [Macrosiphum euphorbiae]